MVLVRTKEVIKCGLSVLATSGAVAFYIQTPGSVER